MLVPVAIVWLLLQPRSGQRSAAVSGAPPNAWWLVAAGPVTVVPLVCFNAAARHLPYTTLGFLQYVAPTLVLGLAVLVFGEHLASEHAGRVCFYLGGTGRVQRRRLDEFAAQPLIKKRTTPYKPRPTWPASVVLQRLSTASFPAVCAQALETVGFLINPG